MRNDNVISTKTEPIFNNYDLFKGPFQYSPFTIGHPDQPDDDHSVRDPTVKTIEKSKFTLSPIHTNQEVLFFKVFKISNDKLSCHIEESSFQLFSRPTHNNLKRLQTYTKPLKLKQKFIDVLSKTIKMNYKIMKFMYLFDLDQLGLQRQYVLLPNSVILKIWNIFYYLLLFLYLLIIPISEKSHQVAFLILKIVDCSLKACSAVAINGEIESNINIILKKYYKKYLIFDIIFLISLILIIRVEKIDWIILLINILSILPRFTDLHNNIQLYLLILLVSEFDVFKVYQQVILLIIQQCIFIHIITCFWIYNIENDNEDNFSQRYLKTLQLIVSITTFNSNQTNLNDNNQIIAYCCISILSFYYFAYQFSILIELFKPEQRSSQLSHFFTQNKLDTILKQKIRSHLENQSQFSHKEFTDKLSNKLLKEYNIVQRQKLLSQQFKYLNNFTLKQIIDNCIEIVCQPNENIFQEGITDDCSLYFILEGCVHLKSRTNIILLTLKQFATFGELSFYTENPRDLTAITDGTTRLIKIQRSTFLSLLNFNEKQFFYEQRDLILFNQKLPSECICCNSQQHIITNCPYLTYQPDLSFILKKYIYPHKQNRKEYKRKKSKDVKAYSFYKQALDFETAFQNLVEDYLQNFQQSQTQIQIEENHIKDSYVSSFSKISKERSFIKSTSFLKQQSGFDQQSVFNNDNLILNGDQNNEFQFIHSSQEYDLSSKFRTDQQKRTFNTAGFGSQGGLTSNKEMTQNLTEKSLNIIMENDDSDSHHDQEQRQQQVQNDINEENIIEDKFIRKNNDPKLTFNNNFESQMHDQNQNRLQRLGSGSYRQQSSMNSTYLHPEVVSQRLNSSRSLTNNQYKPNLNQSQYIKKSSFSIPQKLIQQSRQLDNFNQDENKNSNLMNPFRKSMTRIGSKVSNIASSFSPFSAQEIPIYANKSFGLDDFDVMYAFENYFTHNNYEITIFQANKIKNVAKIRFSKYLTDYKLVKMVDKLKQQRITK
ncbi:unnamed protein product [Paramecium primaurelia]|uniref:Cyclic nucleotide-binding domain-containing protein n=1 Tax=Paramecium primaurelia TaxID=5886 RepID=A0A8S1NC52_PARPR|nr:unnamed protein product [Paramecium primaurelia]